MSKDICVEDSLSHQYTIFFSVHCIVVLVGLKLLSVSAPFFYPATDFFSFKGELILLLLAPLIKYYNVCICKLFCRVVSGNATIM